MPNELKPCKYCGVLGAMVKVERVTELINGFQVICYNCGIRGPIKETKRKAIAAWNRRAGEE